ncbi:MAG: Maf family protein, partial [Kiritimatiellaeota bacterium]|nr:Maf family protein [Kiritimatiellota bacterium]
MFIAATASARRHKILRELGVDFEVFVTHCEETHDEFDAVGTVVANALAKHREAAEHFPDAWIIAADTVVEFEGRCIGKPVDYDDARRMLMAFSGKRQTVFTAVAMCGGVAAQRRSDHRSAATLRVVASSVM